MAECINVCELASVEKLGTEAAVVHVSKWDCAMHGLVLTTLFGENGARVLNLVAEAYVATVVLA